MPSFDAYEINLGARLAELRQGDRAYELHGDAILETLSYDSMGAPETERPRILDVGCGLGFLTVKLATWPNASVVGIDPSVKAIELARQEHAAVSNAHFYAASAQEFPAQMDELGERPFDRAILNMVLHSVDDDTCADILDGTRRSLVPHGILTLVLPDRYWLMQKLIEKAQAEGMDRNSGTAWVADLMSQEAINLRVNIHGQPAYGEAITIFNRTLEDYAHLVRDSGFGLDIRVFDTQTLETKGTVTTTLWEWSDHMMGRSLATHHRHILMTQVR